MSTYAELAVTSNFSFLRGASSPEDLVMQAKSLGLEGIGIADRNSVAGVVRAHATAQACGMRLAVGARLVFSDGTPDILAYPKDRAAWGRLTRLLSMGKLRAEKGDCLLGLADLLEFIEGLNLIVMPSRPLDSEKLEKTVLRLKQSASRQSLWLGATILYQGDDARRIAQLAAIARDTFIPLIAVNDVLYHVPERRAMQDIVTCIREHVTIDNAGRLLESNGERYLKSASEMQRIFGTLPEAVSRSVYFFSQCNFSLDELKETEYPEETRKGFPTPQDALISYTEEGALRRYPNGISAKVRHALDEELRLVGELKYAPFFLTVHDIVKFARRPDIDILCQGRGSAANSVICYCLGITDVAPEKVDLLFERFVSAERQEPPDIDVDFEHSRREEVIQYIYRTYSRERAGLAATVICYRGRSAIREVGKVFGLSEDATGALSSTLWGWSDSGVKPEDVRRAGLDPSDPRLARVLAFAKELIGFPRHLSQHVGGFVVTRSRLDEVVPIENAAMEERTVIEWDKDDLDTLGLLKVDVLGLGMLSCLQRAFALLRSHYGKERNLAVQDEDGATYRMIQRADTIGVFQIESRAQMSMLPRLKPAKFYDLVIEVAIVRPGPIQGNMVHPYLKRRQGKEEVVYPIPKGHQISPLEEVLKKTLGVPLFQEHAMRIAIVAAGFAPGEADRLRRAMATFKRTGTITTFRAKFIDGMVERGYEREFAENCFSQIEGFGEYGFPESHAASFANLVYASAWIKCHYPDVFAAALLNSQPMGFYAPSQLVRDAQDHGVEVRPVDINASHWDCMLEAGECGDARVHARHSDQVRDILTNRALRLGFRQVSGLSETDGLKIADVRGEGFDSVRDFWLRTRLAPAVLEKLAAADAFRSLGLDRRDALWAVRGLRRSGDKDDLPLFAQARMAELEPDANLPAMPLGRHVVEDYRTLHLSLKAHPVSFVRADLDARGIVRNEELRSMRPGGKVTVSGLVLVRQRPGSANGVIFMTLEDETGVANAIVWPKVFEQYRPVVMGSRLVSVTGKLQNEAGVIHVVAEQIEDLSDLLQKLSDEPIDFDILARTDEVKHPVSERSIRQRHPRNVTFFKESETLAGETEKVSAIHRIMPKGRNFH
jgi:error-prone DNA polymerase